MIKNIPNKYTPVRSVALPLARARSKQKPDSTTTFPLDALHSWLQRMILDLLNETHFGRYTTFYLPIDSRNVCNMGYFFLDLVDARYVCTRMIASAHGSSPRQLCCPPSYLTCTGQGRPAAADRAVPGQAVAALQLAQDGRHCHRHPAGPRCAAGASQQLQVRRRRPTCSVQGCLWDDGGLTNIAYQPATRGITKQAPVDHARVQPVPTTALPHQRSAQGNRDPLVYRYA